jgi:hypothetical protein
MRDILVFVIGVFVFLAIVVGIAMTSSKSHSTERAAPVIVGVEKCPASRASAAA